MTSIIRALLWFIFIDVITGGRIVGNDLSKLPSDYCKNIIKQSQMQTQSPCIITNKNDLI